MQNVLSRKICCFKPTSLYNFKQEYLVTTKPGRPKAPKKITIENIYTRTANVTWSVGLCVTGGSVQRYELKLTETGYYDARTNGNNIHENNLIEEDARIQFKGNNKQGRINCKKI